MAGCLLRGLQQELSVSSWYVAGWASSQISWLGVRVLVEGQLQARLALARP